jgi:hypothetical protein
LGHAEIIANLRISQGKSLSDWLNPSFGFLTIAWIRIISPGVYGWNTPLFVLLLLAIPLEILLYAIFRRLQRNPENSPEEIFP